MLPSDSPSARVLGLLVYLIFITSMASADLVQHKFTIGTKRVHRLCRAKRIPTVNGQFPGPTIYIHEGDTVVVEVDNKSPYNITIHWHGIRQLRTCWADGPAYITQCPIAPGQSYKYKFIVTGQEGTLWWHAHNSWLRATVYGALVIYPRIPKPYPFPQPYAEVLLLLGEWWIANVEDVLNKAIRVGGIPNISDAFTINGQPGDLYACSCEDTSRLLVDSGETYLLRIINAALNQPLFFSIAGHKFTVVAVDASYTKPYKTNVLVISPGQTTDILLTANKPFGEYYMAARAYNSAPSVPFDNTTTTAILQYNTISNTSLQPVMPSLPDFNDFRTAYRFSTKLRSLSLPDYPVNVPTIIDEELFITIGLGLLNCPHNSCPGGLNGTKVVGNMNNISFVLPTTAILQAQFFGIDGVFTRDFPSNPPVIFDYTARNQLSSLSFTEEGTKVKVLKFNSTVQVILQDTSIVSVESHPMHVHGYDFYVVGQGFGNYNPQKHLKKFNLVNPQRRNTILVLPGGWAAIRFTVDNPGVWLMHCHLDVHSIFGLTLPFLVENGPGEFNSLVPPPSDLPQC